MYIDTRSVTKFWFSKVDLVWNLKMQVTIKVEPRQLNRLCYVRLHTYECSHPFDFIPVLRMCTVSNLKRALADWVQ